VKRWFGSVPASSEFQVLDKSFAAGLREGWQSSDLPMRQWEAFAPILEQMRSGKYRRDFLALAEAVKSTALKNPLIVEIGCGSGWNSEVLNRLAGPVRYVGSDYSFGMVDVGKAHYTDVPFLVCDAVSLPLPNEACDILLSGTALMHIVEYPAAILESRRVSRRFAIFHTVPVHSRRETTILKKRAYGEWVVEVVFNEGELINLFRQSGFKVKLATESIPYDLIEVTGEHSVTKTYVCEVV
jgi:ubiquinone/menaquinone biosynthesis C-methylase UbiE